MLPKKNYVIPREREMDFIPEIWNSLSETVNATKKWHGVKIPRVYNFFINRKCYCIYEKSGLEKVSKYIANRLVTKPAYFKKIWRLHKLFGKQAERIARNVLSTHQKLNSLDEPNVLRLLKANWIRFDQVNVLPWFTAAESLREYIEKRLVSQYKVPEKDIEILRNANTLSLPSLEEVSLFKAGIKHKKGIDLKILCKKLSKEFGWIPFGYDGPTFWDENFYQKKLLSLNKKSIVALNLEIDKIIKPILRTKQRQKEIISKYKINANLVRLLDIQQKLYTMTDERKKVQFQIHHAYHKVLKQLGARYHLTLEELKYLETEEVATMVKEQTFIKFKKISKNRTKNPLYTITENGKFTHIESSPKTGEKLFKFVENTETIKSFSGQVANTAKKNILTGRVRIISSSRLAHTIKKGEILVTGMTTPDFVQAMKMAKGIITDEGGITSHAAIVSRELGVPCIIGTKVATQILKTGDLIEVNANTGIIRLLKKKA